MEHLTSGVMSGQAEARGLKRPEAVAEQPRVLGRQNAQGAGFAEQRLKVTAGLGKTEAGIGVKVRHGGLGRHHHFRAAQSGGHVVVAEADNEHGCD